MFGNIMDMMNKLQAVQGKFEELKIDSMHNNLLKHLLRATFNYFDRISYHQRHSDQ